MGRNRYAGYLDETNRGHLVAFDLQWHVIESRRVDPRQGAAMALAGFIREFEARGWEAESDGAYGFVFMRRNDQRILLEVTPRDPYDAGSQSFSPFR
jgi:hypothetical protein